MLYAKNVLNILQII